MQIENNDLISREALRKALHNFFDGKVIDEPAYILRDVFCYIESAPTVETYYTNDDILEAEKEGYERGKNEIPQGECKSCRHRDPEDKKCDCGAIERQGCPFPVSNDYYCKHYEKGDAE